MNDRQKRLIGEAIALLEQASEAVMVGDQAAFDRLVREAADRIALAGPRALLDTPVECPDAVRH